MRDFQIIGGAAAWIEAATYVVGLEIPMLGRRAGAVNTVNKEMARI